MNWSLDFEKPQEVYLQDNKQENKNYKRDKDVILASWES
jgi:putative transposase